MSVRAAKKVSIRLKLFCLWKAGLNFYLLRSDRKSPFGKRRRKDPLSEELGGAPLLGAYTSEDFYIDK
jgi:hypothetical protein